MDDIDDSMFDDPSPDAMIDALHRAGVSENDARTSVQRMMALTPPST